MKGFDLRRCWRKIDEENKGWRKMRKKIKDLIKGDRKEREDEIWK